MWRMALVAAAVGLIYALVPLLRSEQPIDQFGKPWTVNSFLEALHQEGVTVQLRGDPKRFQDVLPNQVVATGTINDFPFTLAVYGGISSRSADWLDEEAGRVEPRRPIERIGIISIYGADNAVIVIYGFLHGPGYDFAEIRRSVLTIRNH